MEEEAPIQGRQTMEQAAHRGLSWDHKTGKGTALMAIIALVASLFVAATGPATATESGTVDLIVRETHPVSDTAETLVERLGGVVRANLDIIGGFTATVPASTISIIESDPSVAAATPNAALQLSTAGWEDASTLGDMDPRTHPGSMYEVTHYTKARDLWSLGITGAGVDIALIDSGVAPVNGLTAPGKIVNGPDLSLESQNPDF
jgi:serine protease AprX